MYGCVSAFQPPPKAVTCHRSSRPDAASCPDEIAAPSARAAASPAILRLRTASPSLVVVRRAGPVPPMVLEVVVGADLRVRNAEERERAQQQVSPPGLVAHADAAQDRREVQADLEADLLIAGRDRRRVPESLRQEREGDLQVARGAERRVEAPGESVELQAARVHLVRVVEAEALKVARDDLRRQRRRDLPDREP